MISDSILNTDFDNISHFNCNHNHKSIQKENRLSGTSKISEYSDNEIANDNGLSVQHLDILEARIIQKLISSDESINDISTLETSTDKSNQMTLNHDIIQNKNEIDEILEDHNRFESSVKQDHLSRTLTRRTESSTELQELNTVIRFNRENVISDYSDSALSATDDSSDDSEYDVVVPIHKNGYKQKCGRTASFSNHSCNNSKIGRAHV